MRYVIQIVGRKHDPEGEYVKLWVPELVNVPKQYIHKPWKITEAQQEEYNVRLGIDYPNPIRDPSIGDKRRKVRYLRRKGMELPDDDDDKEEANNEEDDTTTTNTTTERTDDKVQRKKMSMFLGRQISNVDDWYGEAKSKKDEVAKVAKTTTTSTSKWRVDLSTYSNGVVE
jgi:FAD binding domain of DNA photolyase